MGTAWIPPPVSLFLFLGVGGPALGLVRLLRPSARSGWGSVAALALGLASGAFAGAALLAAQPTGVWLPPAVLLGLCVLLELPCRHALVRLGALARGPLNSPFVQAAGLLVGCPALAVWMLLDRPGDASTLEAVLFNSPPLSCQLQEVRPSPLTTDKGRSVVLWHVAGVEERGPKRAATQEQILNRPDLRARIIALDVTGSSDCNCHGWVFTGGLFWVRGDAVETILKDNGYRQVAAPRGGDVAVYRDPAGAITHTGLVRATTPDRPVLVESKWGELGAFIHPVDVHPYLGSTCTYHRSPRAGHRLREAAGTGGSAVAALRVSPLEPCNPAEASEPPLRGE
jgi:hypothetical protein